MPLNQITQPNNPNPPRADITPPALIRCVAHVESPD